MFILWDLQLKHLHSKLTQNLNVICKFIQIIFISENVTIGKNENRSVPTIQMVPHNSTMKDDVLW